MQAQRGTQRARAYAGRRTGALVGAALLLLALLVVARFPYRRLLPPLLDAASAATGARIVVGDVGLGLGRGGPEVEATDLSLEWPSAAALHLATLRVRPAWSLAWLSGAPRWNVEAAGEIGSWAGVLAPDRLAGEWSELQIDALPWASIGSAAPLHGRVSGQLDLTRADGAWQGSAQLLGNGGSVDMPGLPVAIPFEALRADLSVAPGALTLTAGRIEGPLVTASLAGTATVEGDSFSSWALALDVEIEEVDAALRGYLSPMGIPVGPEGRAKLRVTGSLGAPYLSSTPP